MISMSMGMGMRLSMSMSKSKYRSRSPTYTIHLSSNNKGCSSHLISSHLIPSHLISSLIRSPPPLPLAILNPSPPPTTTASSSQLPFPHPNHPSLISSLSSQYSTTLEHVEDLDALASGSVLCLFRFRLCGGFVLSHPGLSYHPISYVYPSNQKSPQRGT